MVSRLLINAFRDGHSYLNLKTCRVFAERIFGNGASANVVKTVVRNDGKVYKSIFDSAGKRIGNIREGISTNGYGGVYWKSGVQGSLWDRPY